MEHYPVLADEVVGYFSTSDAPKRIIDATVGAGGHSALLLDTFTTATIVAVDADARMIERARQRLAYYLERVSFVHMWFDDFFASFTGSVDRILFDLGISLFHVALPEAGFSFRDDGPLDMRLQADSGVPSAADYLRTVSEEELANTIYEYGEERYSRRIAGAIVRRRKQRPFTSTADLAGVVAGAVTGVSGGGKSSRRRRHPAVRTFQALRIRVNDELNRISRALPKAAEHLAPGGRLAVISFHSLEDRIVKHTFKSLQNPASGHSTGGGNVPMVDTEGVRRFRVITRKPVIPTIEEINRNAPSRSAKLRVLECCTEESAGE